jgi:phosphoribosylformylglycinamidine synthase
MSHATIEIKFKNLSADPMARQVRAELIEHGQPAAIAQVLASRLYRIEGNFSAEQFQSIADTLLVDPVIEVAELHDLETKSKKKAAKVKGVVVDVWPKPGVTDPVAETVKKGLKDLGLFSEAKTSYGLRYIFPKIKDAKFLAGFAKKTLANELVHAIDVR